MIDEQLENLESLKHYLADENCHREPFIKLGNGNAPTLNYNLPQNSTFTTYGCIPIDVERDKFNEACKRAPADNFFSYISNMEESAIQQKISEAVQLQNDHTPLVANLKLIHKNLNANKTDLEAVSLNTKRQQPNIVSNETYLNEFQLAKISKEYGKMPVITEKLNGKGTKVNFLSAPQNPTPRIFVIEEYKTSSYLGNYGAGKTIQTFSLLPNEKTTITMRTYRNNAITKSQSENLLDSVSQNSVDEMEQLIEEECGMENSSSDTTTNNVKVETSISGVLFGAMASASAGYSYGNNKTASRTANSKALNRALNKHVSQSNSNRNIEINATTSENVNEGEEYTTVREIENINKSRVLNFVFRQLLQEYVSITYLSNIRIAYTNGYMESLRVVDLEELDDLIEEIIVDDGNNFDDVKESILENFVEIMDYNGEMREFIEEKSVNYGMNGNKTATFWTRVQETQRYEDEDSNLDIRIPGVILQVQKNILKTDSVVVDALLGQGEALDCYNQKAQEAIVMSENLKNLVTLQQMEVVEGISDPEQKAELYKKVFKDCCCGCPQTQIISNTTNSSQQ